MAAGDYLTIHAWAYDALNQAKILQLDGLQKQAPEWLVRTADVLAKEWAKSGAKFIGDDRAQVVKRLVEAVQKLAERAEKDDNFAAALGTATTTKQGAALVLRLIESRGLVV